MFVQFCEYAFSRYSITRLYPIAYLHLHVQNIMDFAELFSRLDIIQAKNGGGEGTSDMLSGEAPDMTRHFSSGHDQSCSPIMSRAFLHAAFVGLKNALGGV